jgi:hypothetical protein
MRLLKLATAVQIKVNEYRNDQFGKSSSHPGTYFLEITDAHHIVFVYGGSQNQTQNKGDLNIPLGEQSAPIPSFHTPCKFLLDHESSPSLSQNNATQE